MPLSSRDISIPRKAPPAQGQPPSHSHSKLPRRVVTPNSTPPAITPWTGRGRERGTPVARVASETRKLTPGESVVIRSQQKTQILTPPATDKPLPGDKPLPSRPILRLSNALSPSKDSRGLIDAAEAPLHITSIADEKHEWPALLPQTSRSPSTSPTPTPSQTPTSEALAKDEPAAALSSLSGTMATDASAAESAPFVTARTSRQEQNGTTNSRSPASSYASAIEGSSPVHESSDSTLEVAENRLSIESTSGVQHDAHAKQHFPARQSSLDHHMTFRNLASAPSALNYKVPDSTDSEKMEAAPATPSESRTHSPSPASFSRPRRSSRSMSSMSIKTANTASRIPIPDSKKATVIDVKGNRVSGSSSAKLSLAPSFGSRRLASPEALKILENGKLRRQLKRIPDPASTASPQLERTNTNNSGSSLASTIGTPSLSYSPGTSPEGTLGSNSPVPPMHEFAHGFDERNPNRSVASPSCLFQARNENVNMFDDDPATFAKAPPPTSPFTGFLQTIPSEAALPLENVDPADEPNSELTRTLSHLEGKGSPPKSRVDYQTLQHLFGHLKQTVGNNSTAFVENAAAAEKYLALGQDAEATPVSEPILNEAQSQPMIAGDSGTKVTAHSTGPSTNKKKYTVASKWSESTPSDKGLSPLGEGLNATEEASATQRHRSIFSTGSIGYPARVAARTGTANDQSPAEGATVADIARRRSSPTLGKPKPGSVRAAREGLYTGHASFARTTASAESKKTGKRPAASSRGLTSTDPSQRGRISSAEKAGPKVNGTAPPKTPRSRSKSRYVLDKINGLFSGKRERKTDAAPPVPLIDGTTLPDSPNGIAVSARGSPTIKPARTPRLPKMPSLSHSSHIALRSGSRGTMQTDDSAMIDNVTARDESHSVQALSEHLIGKAQRETNWQRKERLLSFAKVLNDSLINAREAQISAETAQHAAKCAQLSYEMTQKSLSMLQKLASSVTRNSSHTKH